MQAAEVRVNGVIIVDARPEDYEPILAHLARQRAPGSVFTLGEAALRTTQAQPSTLWMVNMRLPDMSGVSLLALVRRRFRRSSVVLVGDFYSAEDELAARAAGATAYVCKPPMAEWLEGCRPAGAGATARMPPRTPELPVAIHPP
jgi:DNA-binding response OmpR family regulator